MEGGPHDVFAADVADASSARDLVEGVAGEIPVGAALYYAAFSDDTVTRIRG
jgi:hypothetical protein